MKELLPLLVKRGAVKDFFIYSSGVWSTSSSISASTLNGNAATQCGTKNTEGESNIFGKADYNLPASSNRSISINVLLVVLTSLNLLNGS